MFATGVKNSTKILLKFKTKIFKDVVKDPDAGAENPSIMTNEHINFDPKKSAGIRNSMTPSPYEDEF